MHIGTGIFMWDASERRSQRYGHFYLLDKTFDGSESSKLMISPQVKELNNKRVEVYAIVKKSRKSSHLGDSHLGIFPVQPKTGQKVVIGVGTFKVTTNYDGKIAFGLVPSDPKRVSSNILWNDPRKWYLLHDQTVKLYVEETDAPDTVFDLHGTNEGTIAVDVDAKSKKVSAQVCTPGFAGDSEVSLHPKVTSMGDGLFMMEYQTPVVGEKVKSTIRKKGG